MTVLKGVPPEPENKSRFSYHDLPLLCNSPDAMEVAKLISKRWHDVPGRLRVAELFFDVPFDYRQPDGAKLRLFARSVHRRSSSIEDEPAEKQLPWLLFLQGGPGMPSPQPQDNNWLGPFLDKGYQILLLDQRGTGLSSPITAATLGLRGDAVRQAEYLKMFRADNIVRDCEAIRACLTEDYLPEKKKWSLLGQSFGGFCTITYLSKFPHGLREVFTCGGLAPLVRSPEPVYERTYLKVQERNEAYYAKFPEDVERVRTILDHLDKTKVTLPSGGDLIPDRFLELGIGFGMKGGLDVVHDVVLRCINELETASFLTRPTLAAIENEITFDHNVLYAILHEPIYCQGNPSNWTADRLKSHFAGFRSEKDPTGIYFTGEMVYKHIFDTSPELHQMKEAAEIIANTSDWPDLYDKAQLARNEVPVYSATYVDDMYVDCKLATQTAGAIKNCKYFLTNMMYHDALRVNSDEVIRQLFALRDDTLD